MPAGAHNRFCPLSMALDTLGDPWSLLVVRALLFGPRTRESLSVFLAGLDSDALSGVIGALLDADIIRCNANDLNRPDATFELTERGLSLAPVVQELTRWGLNDLLLPEASEPDRARESFDQSWTVSDIRETTNEVYGWTIDGKAFALELAGTTLTRTLGPPSAPSATLETSSGVFDALIFGETSLSEALMRGDLKLSGTPAAISRMFQAAGLPPELFDSAPPG